MTPNEIIELARAQYNAVNEKGFYTDAELRGYLTAGCKELAAKSLCIKKIFTTTTVASTAEYSIPSYAISIKRITYDGKKLHSISFREDDVATLSNSTSTQTGTPNFYTQFATSMFLRPIPDDAKTLKIYAICNAQPILESTTTFEIPEDYHHDMTHYLNWRMALKDENPGISKAFIDLWKSAVVDARILERRKVIGDSFGHVQAIEVIPTSTFGTT